MQVTRIIAAALLVGCAGPSTIDNGGAEPDTRSPKGDNPNEPDATGEATFEVPAPEAIGDADRPATLVVPEGYDGTEALPAVILMGGYQYYAWELDAWIGVSDLVDENRLVLVMPDGTEDEDGWPFWAATDTCCDYDESGVDDVGYLTRLLDDLTARVNVDPARIALVGHSNGAFMAYRMACEVPERIAAVVSIAGSGFLDPADCRAETPVSVLQVHGVEDEVMPIAGDAAAPGAVEMMERWGARAGCDIASWEASGEPLELVDDETDGETTAWSFAEGCDLRFDVRLWSMEGADHYPEVRPAFTEAVVEWLLAHSRP